jgi:alpha-glucuronidase
MEIISSKGEATASEVKNAFQGIASSQETLLKAFHKHNEEFKKRIGVNRTQGTYSSYQSGYFHLEQFIIQ